MTLVPVLRIPVTLPQPLSSEYGKKEILASLSVSGSSFVPFSSLPRQTSATWPENMIVNDKVPGIVRFVVQSRM